ncbi:MAG: signal peptide peptidase SppA [Deltaproteobacteria bacterium]|nr:MAG: signal peptide peptidase SppA [Deltaproteobacteria bacterium]
MVSPLRPRSGQALSKPDNHFFSTLLVQSRRALQRLIRGVLCGIFWGINLLARAFEGTYNTLRLDLSGSLPEEGPSLLATLWRAPGMDFLTLISLLRWAREDERIRAVVLTVADLDVGWARLQSLRRSLLALRQAGKHVWVYLTEGGTREYYLASAADTVVLAPAGHLAVTGIAAETLFFKGALDKLGIEAQVHQAGQYKAAGEAFTRESMSGPHREMLEGLLDDLYSQIVEGIALARNKSKAEVQELIDQGLFLAREALTAGLVDQVDYEDAVPARLEAKIGPVQVIEAGLYQRRRVRALRCQLLRYAPRKIALVTVGGPVKRGETVDSPEGGRAVGSTSFARDLKRVRDDQGVAAVVVRIASPGGSGVASDLMWRELLRTRERKPVIVSMGDVAASGGYYLALAGEKLFAEEGTITGSIGVIAGKAVLHDLYTHLGVGKEILTRGRRAALFSDYLAFAPPERERLEFEIQAFYQDFVEKVARCRSLSAEAVEPSAQGRVWSGRQAWVRGLVDEMGGLEEALAEAKRRMGLPAERPVIVERIPKAPSSWRLSLLLRLLPRTSEVPWWWARERVWAILPFSLRLL